MKQKALVHVMFAGLFILIFSAGEVGAQDVRLAWSRQCVKDMPANPMAPPAIDDFGNIYVTGYENYESVIKHILKYDPYGNELWHVTTSPNVSEKPVAHAVDGSGNLYLLGKRTYPNRYMTTKYDTNGNELWVTLYEGFSWAEPKSLAVDGEGNVYVTGSAFATVKYDTDGNELWVATRDGGSANHVVVDASGNVYVTGRSDTNDDSSYLTIKYDTNGNELWAVTYGGPWNLFNTYVPVGLAVDASGNVYVSGVYLGGMDTVKYDSDGNELWVARYADVGSTEGNLMAIDSDGSVYVVGKAWGGLAYDCAVVKYDTDGNQLWVTSYGANDSEGNPTDIKPTSMAVDDSGNVYLTGHFDYSIRLLCLFNPICAGYTQVVTTTIKYDSDGNQIWVAENPGWWGGYFGFGGAYLSVDAIGDVYLAASQGTSYWFTNGWASRLVAMKYTTNPPDPVCGTYPVAGPASAYFLPYLLIPVYLLISLRILRRKRL